MATLHRVLPEQLPDAWTHASYYLQRALDETQGECSLEKALEFFTSGRWQLWVMREAGYIVGALATQIVHYAHAQMCEGIYMSTSLPREEWLALVGNDSELEKWARFVKCTHIMLHGRKGFERIGTEHGYERWYTCVGKTLTA